MTTNICLYYISGSDLWLFNLKLQDRFLDSEVCRVSFTLSDCDCECMDPYKDIILKLVHTKAVSYLCNQYYKIYHIGWVASQIWRGRSYFVGRTKCDGNLLLQPSSRFLGQQLPGRAVLSGKGQLHNPKNLYVNYTHCKRDPIFTIVFKTEGEIFLKVNESWM